MDGQNSDAVAAAIQQAQAETARPTLICCKTTIGWGSPNRAGTHKAHGEALGVDEVALARKQLGWTAEPFVIPEPILKDWDCREKGKAAEAKWETLFGAYKEALPGPRRRARAALEGRPAEELVRDRGEGLRRRPRSRPLRRPLASPPRRR